MLEKNSNSNAFFLIVFLPATTKSNRVVMPWNIIPVVAKNKIKNIRKANMHENENQTSMRTSKTPNKQP